MFFIDENENIVLIDYKTDYIPENNENYLIQKYKKQLKLYSRAIENALKKPVNSIYIYSTFLNKEIQI